MTREKRKVFCIGFHKTGTSSMGKALERLGYSVTGPNGTKDPEISRNVHAMAERLLPRYDAFQDNPWPILYRWAYARCRDAKYILTLRDPDHWYSSALRHFAGNHTPMREWIYGIGNGAPAGNRKVYLERFNLHNAEVQRFFAGSDQLLLMDVTAGDGWEKLCPFLGHPLPDAPFPHVIPARTGRAEPRGGSP